MKTLKKHEYTAELIYSVKGGDLAKAFKEAKDISRQLKMNLTMEFEMSGSIKVSDSAKSLFNPAKIKPQNFNPLIGQSNRADLIYRLTPSEKINQLREGGGAYGEYEAARENILDHAMMKAGNIVDKTGQFVSVECNGHYRHLMPGLGEV